jgi:hypothetical protein
LQPRPIALSYFIRVNPAKWKDRRATRSTFCEPSPALALRSRKPHIGIMRHEGQAGEAGRDPTRTRADE